MFPKFNEYIEDYEQIKYPTLIPTDEKNMELLKKYKEMWNEIKYLIKLRNNLDDNEDEYMK